MLSHLEVPTRFNRNSPDVAELGPENTGQQLIELATREAGLRDLCAVDILDVGCGVRFTQALINRKIPFGSYTGVEVHKPLVEFLKEHVESKDPRFRFVHWDVRNARYNPRGSLVLDRSTPAPVTGTFGLIWLFSVFTHLDADDAAAMLVLLRKLVAPDGRLFFSAFIDTELEGFEDRVPGNPLLNAYFGLEFMRRMLAGTGWTVDRFRKRGSDLPIVDYFVCSPR